MQVSSSSSPAVTVPAPDIAALTHIAVAADAANAATGTSAQAAAAIVDPDPSKGGSVDTYA